LLPDYRAGPGELCLINDADVNLVDMQVRV
jgi:hypothetical protein